MSVPAARKQVMDMAVSLGRAALHFNWPNDFEYYALGLDLTDSSNRIINSLVFPEMPENITEPRPSINTVKKTESAVVSMYNTSFVPFDISIRGTFGRKLRLLTSNPLHTFNKGGVVQGSDYDVRPFNTSIKTGYGTLKLLEKIRDQSFSVDAHGKPTRLYYYNLALNSQYLVEFKSLNMQQDRQNNMLWYYTANFKAIAPAFLIRPNNSTSVINLLASSVINKAVDRLLTGYKDTYNLRRSRKKSGTT